MKYMHKCKECGKLWGHPGCSWKTVRFGLYQCCDTWALMREEYGYTPEPSAEPESVLIDGYFS